MRILVTGSEGSLMQAVIPGLLKNGHEVIGVDYNTPEPRTEYKLIAIDLRNYPMVLNLFRTYDFDVVIQGAAQIYGVAGFNKQPADILSGDIAVHSNIMNAAVLTTKPRIVYISSSMVYEQCTRSWAVKENEPEKYPAPKTGYGLSKYVGERLTRAYQEQYGIKYTIWRPFNIITPYELKKKELGFSHVFVDFMHNIIKEKKNPLPIIGNGEQVRCFTWIYDVSQAIIDYSFDDKSINQSFNLGNQEPVTMKELARLIYEKVNDREGIINPPELKFDTTEVYDLDVFYRVPDVSKMIEFYNWEAKQKLHESIDKCIDAFYEREINV